MPLSNPSNPLIVNPGAAAPLNNTALVGQNNRVISNQIRGQYVTGSTGSAVPKPVTNVQASVGNASAGATSTVNVQFRRDPSDTTYQSVVIYAKGYQGNSQAVQVGSSIDSPATLILNNTGESITLIVQSQGNAGITPLANCPSVGLKLQKSAGGGVGTTTVTQLVTSNSAIGGDLSGSLPAAKVVGFEGNPIDGTLTILDGDVYRWSVTAAKWEKAMMFDWAIIPGAASATPLFYGMSSGSGAYIFNNSLLAGGTNSNVNGTATQLAGIKYTTSASAGSTAGWINNSNAGTQTAPLGVLRRTRFRLQLNQTTNCRMWFGLQFNTGVSNAVWAVDTMSTSFIGFRFHAGTDTFWQAVTNSSGTQTTTPTTVTPDTNVHDFDIIYNAGTVTFYIDGVLAATLSTNVPAATTQLSPGAVIDNVGAANAEAWSFYYAKGTVDWALM